jgi:hypothetical protein
VLGVERRVALVDRRLVVMSHEHLMLALSVDTVRDPEEFLAQDVTLAARFGGAQHGELARVLRAIVRSARGSLAVVEPLALLSQSMVAELVVALTSQPMNGAPAVAPQQAS